MRQNFTERVTTTAAENYDVRIYWSCGLEICALIFCTFALLVQMIYAISIRRNRNG